MKTSIRKRKYDDEALNNGNPQKSIIYKEPKSVERATDSGLANNQWWKTGKSSVNYAPKVQTDSAVKGAPLVGESPYKIPPSNNDLYPNTDYMQNMLDAEKIGDYNTAAYWERMRNEKIANGYGGNYAPTNFYNYNSKYADKIADLRDQYENYGAFSYDPLEDEAYQNLANVYRKNASDASANALAQMAAANGGRLSSNAAIASDLAYQNKMSGLEGEIPALRQLAYNMYLGDKNDLRTVMGDYMNQEAQDYARWSDALDRRIENNRYAIERQDIAYERAKSENNSEWEKATELMETLGYVTPEMAETLGVDPGTATMSRWLYENQIRQGDEQLAQDLKIATMNDKTNRYGIDKNYDANMQQLRTNAFFDALDFGYKANEDAMAYYNKYGKYPQQNTNLYPTPPIDGLDLSGYLSGINSGYPSVNYNPAVSGGGSGGGSRGGGSVAYNPSTPATSEPSESKATNYYKGETPARASKAVYDAAVSGAISREEAAELIRKKVFG